MFEHYLPNKNECATVAPNSNLLELNIVTETGNYRENALVAVTRVQSDSPSMSPRPGKPAVPCVQSRERGTRSSRDGQARTTSTLRSYYAPPARARHAPALQQRSTDADEVRGGQPAPAPATRARCPQASSATRIFDTIKIH